MRNARSDLLSRGCCCLIGWRWHGISEYTSFRLLSCWYLTILYSTVTCIRIARKRVGRHIPATHMNATIGHPLLGNGPVNTHSWQPNAVFSVVSVQSGYKKCSAGQNSETTDPFSHQRERPTSTSPQLSNSNKDLVLSPRWVLYSKTDRPTEPSVVT
jgi:hypothetical protein